jgi:hypothetical protein
MPDECIDELIETLTIKQLSAPYRLIFLSKKKWIDLKNEGN